MTRSFSITEPHPSVPSSHFMYSGRGGAGNIARVDPSTITPGSTATGPASRTKLTSSPAAAYYSGRGGAGNVRQHKERAIFSFDEELAAQRKLMERAAPVYHIGRGGAGNFIEETGQQAPQQVQRKNSSDSAGSSVEERRSGDSMWNRVTRTLSRS